MKHFILFLVMLFSMSLTTNAQNYVRNGNTFSVTSKTNVKCEPIKTKFIWSDSKGQSYPIYISSTGSCFVIKTSSKTGKEYRNYLGPELSQQVCKELNIEYKSKKK